MSLLWIPLSLSQPGAAPICPSCGQANRKKKMRPCCKCGLKYHLSCVKLSQKQSDLLDNWSCPSCSRRPQLSKKPDIAANVSPNHTLLLISKARRKFGILQRIPKGARILAAESLYKTIDGAIKTNNYSDWMKLFSFASFCLDNPRKQTDTSCSLATFTKRRLSRFLEMSGQDLQTEVNNWADSTLTENPGKVRDDAENFRIQVKSKLMDGDVSAAVRVLAANDSVEQVTPEIIAHMRLKHPKPPADLRPIAQPDRSLTTTFTKEAVLKAIRSFPPSSSGGIDGLRPSHLKDMINKDTCEAGDRLLSSLTALVNHFASGSIPDKARELFFSASLIALSKKDGGSRSIAIGNTLRRLAAKALVRSVASEVSAELQPIQLGFGVKGGCEAVVHATRTLVNEHLGRSSLDHDPQILIKLDVKNAFNSLRRDHMLEVLKLRCPHVYPMAWQAYHSPTSLSFLSNTIIQSSSGIQQGDPMGPLAFALAVDNVSRSLSCPLNAWFLDDATIAGPVAYKQF